MRAPLLLALALSASPAAAASECKPFSSLGCYYAPPDALSYRTAPLVVYLRGWWSPYNGTVPPGKCLESSRQAFAKFELAKAADAAGAVILVTCSSHLGLTANDKAGLESEAGFRASSLSLASHSGGYVGLEKTLDAGLVPDRIILLDTFYFDATLAKKIQAKAFGGAACVGYHTDYTKNTYLKAIKPFMTCSIEDHNAYGHDGGVNKCLGAYLSKTNCP